MNVIDKNKDKIEAISEYMVANRNESDSWEYQHYRNIEEFLNTFTNKESEKLESEIFKWEEIEQYHIADPISDSKNRSIDGNYLYGKIFLSIQDFEMLEYLIQNLVIVVWEYETKRPIEFYESILKKTKSLNKKLNNGYTNLISSIEQKIKKEKADNM